MEITITIGKFPNIPLFNQIKAYLSKKKYKKAKIQFKTEVKDLGACYSGWVNIIKLRSTGVVESWNSYFSDDSVQPTSISRDVIVTEDICYIEIAGWGGKSWVTLYLNPSHNYLFKNFIYGSSGDLKKDRRMYDILEIFYKLIAVARPERLDALGVSKEELYELIESGYLTSQKGKRPEVISQLTYNTQKHQSRIYKLNGAKITPKGETFASWCLDNL